MFTYSKENELTAKILSKMIHHFVTSVLPDLNQRKNYYDGNQAILQKAYKDASKPCNRTVTNYCKNISDSYCGYLATPGYISYSSNQDIEDIMNILKYNDYQTEDADFLLNALIYGVAAELMFIDNNGKTRFSLIDPRSCFGIFDNSLTNDLIYFVRFYKIDEWSDSDKYAVDLYSDFDIKHFVMNGLDGELTLVGAENHFFSQCPANIFMLADEKSIFDCVSGLQDAANELLSSEVDDYEAFCDAYLSLTGVDCDAEDIALMKENRVLVLPEGAQASWVTKNANDAQIENILKRIQESIYRIAQCPDFSSETFVGGVSSGVAIRYRLCGMENRAAKIASEMKKALQRRIEIICGIASLKLGEDVFRDIEINFSRNIPEDINSIVNLVNSLKGVISDATLLDQIPFVDDVNEELERVQAQKQANMALYDFGEHTHEEESDE